MCCTSSGAMNSYRRPASILNVKAVVGIHNNYTTARSSTRNKVPIQVSLMLNPSPRPSTLFVSCSDLNPSIPPDILYAVDNLLLLRVNVGSKYYHDTPRYFEYLVYRVDTSRPSLELLQCPEPLFHSGNVGLLPRPKGHYTVAALIDTGSINCDLYKLHLFHSDTSTWSTSMVSVEAPQKPFPVGIPKYCGELLRHHTAAVVTMGVEGGTMGWVDLWRGILLCDVLHPNPSLRGVPIPLPLTLMSLNNGLGVRLGYPGHCRGITFNRDKGCLMLVHLELDDFPLPGKDEETGETSFQVNDWELTMWSNSKMSDSWEDWQLEHRVQASNINIDNPAISNMLDDSDLLCRPRHITEAAAAQQQILQRKLQNLSMYQPTLCPNGEDVVYLVAREKTMHPKAWILALDMKNGGTLKCMAYFGNQVQPYGSGIYFLSTISN